MYSFPSYMTPVYCHVVSDLLIPQEIAAAMEAGLNIIPLFDNFHWPPPEQLPADMRNLSCFNGVRWVVTVCLYTTTTTLHPPAHTPIPIMNWV